MFLLRFLYFLPSLMKNEPTRTKTATNFQEKLRLLIDFATERRDFYFVWSMPVGAPRPVTPRQEMPKVVQLLNKTA
jgi:hypothetical protein